ncbi:diacylglycerol/lipid kinase family protein [Arthrobacter sp. NPDC090010]|uniref:diacylglycerol/lipid kinase family protein n=1 Tax=Arthrobacter sp. NPDC090010 TaxID=3363942 RepID=UPI0038246E2F
MINSSPTVKPTALRDVRVLLLVNRGSGDAKTSLRAHTACLALQAEGAAVTFLSFADPVGALPLLVSESARADAIVVVGGDGTVQLAAEVALQAGLPLGIVPAGTGNDAARALGLPSDPATAVRNIAKAWGREPRSIDLARVEMADGGSRHYLTTLAAGFDAVVNRRANRLRRPKGTLRYVAALLASLPGLETIHYRLAVDGVAEERDAVILTVANGRSFGGGLRIAPAARLDDGLLDLVTVDPLPRWQLLVVFPLAFLGWHRLHPAVRIRRVRRVEIVSGGPRCHADGEELATPPFTVVAVPGALRILA